MTLLVAVDRNRGILTSLIADEARSAKSAISLIFDESE